MHEPEMSVAMAETIYRSLSAHLIRPDQQEDLIFALWTPSEGSSRLTALIHTLIYPEVGDRQVHGNVSFNPGYFQRVYKLAIESGYGIAFLHSHPFPGWQGMSADDIEAERKMASAVDALTDLPLVGMTLSSNGIWSARMWEQEKGRKYRGRWCHSVRSAGQALRVDFHDQLLPKPEYREMFKRTITVWGKENHANLARLRIGVVGLGSVGIIIAESLARMGLCRFCLIDFDEVQRHNLDRLLGASEDDLGRLKVSIAERLIRSSATAKEVDIIMAPYSIAEEEGYRAALDCDVLFSCVDRPRARHILNHMAYGHFIPVVDGGIAVRFKNEEFSGVDWQLQTVAPGRPCLHCLGTYNLGDVALEESGKLDDPTYMKGLPQNHRLKNNENVFPFSANLASLEVLQFVALATGAGGIHNFGVQRYRFWPGIVDTDSVRVCDEGCDCAELEGSGDRYFQLYGKDLAAQAARKRQKSYSSNKQIC